MVLASSPPVLVWDSFATPSECASLLEGDWQSCEVYETVASRLGTLMKAEPHVHEERRRFLLTPQDNIPDHLHVDTNNGKLATFATAILYLTTVDEGAGGHTCLPLADSSDDDPCLAAAQLLGSANIHHALGAVTEEETRAAELLAIAATDCTKGKRGVKVRPVQGKLLLFYGRKSNGEIDHRSWHRGDALLGEYNKRTCKGICPMLKEVPLEHLASSRTFTEAVASYLKHAQTWLQV